MDLDISKGTRLVISGDRRGLAIVIVLRLKSGVVYMRGYQFAVRVEYLKDRKSGLSVLAR